jgi:hypothetical protein
MRHMLGVMEAFTRASAEPLGLGGASGSAVLVDFDNFYPGGLDSREELTHEVNRMISCALDALPDTDEVLVRLYGGWLDEGVLTKRASALQAAMGSAIFPMPHPSGSGVLRGDVTLVTRLALLPGLEWRHTFRSRTGIPPLRLVDKPRPHECANADNCPIDLLQRISRRGSRECHTDRCTVRNESAFLLREQKMVDSMLCCDVLGYVGRGYAVHVLSDDLDVLPAVAMSTAMARQPVTLVRSTAGAESLYEQDLRRLGVRAEAWEAA